MAQDKKEERYGHLGEDEIALAKVLVRNKKMTEQQLDSFIKLRKKSHSAGKLYLGDVLVKRGMIKEDPLDKFFKDNNKQYLKFIDHMVDHGLIGDDQRKKIMRYKEARQNVVTVIERLGLMTKASFIKLFLNYQTALKLGEWLVANKILDEEKLQDALKEQSIGNLEEYVVYHNMLDRQTIDQIKQKLCLH
ncbi:hypothetical protein MNBD_NITROSPINAE03-1408 [hydrothermal vent metagenome]|uniref:Uncharacterized protein n=1 Tax=hydrothermal vent metagenome TaxID=652676 RepID=A0A3B1BXM6_9ZZZZ